MDIEEEERLEGVNREGIGGVFGGINGGEGRWRRGEMVGIGRGGKRE
jgi:hypothetical protein